MKTVTAEDRMNASLDIVTRREADDFRREAVERRKAEQEKAENQATSSGAEFSEHEA